MKHESDSSEDMEPHHAACAENSFCEIAYRRHVIRVSVERGLVHHFGLSLRRAEVLRRVEHILKHATKSADVQADDLSISCAGEQSAVPGIVQEIDRALRAIAARPLTPGLIQQALGITSQERLRWTKDGRLQQHGSATIRRGQLITLSTYAVAQIEHLAANPTVIADWREQDRQIPRR